MYKLKMGDIVFMFSDEDILNSRVVRNSRLHLPGSENYE